MTAAPLIVTVGLALGTLTQQRDASRAVVGVWSIAFFTVGVGVGIVWPHLSGWAMGLVDDPVEGGAAAARSTPCS
jgi:formate-dependent nitrite reductase membrane component NrfD